MKYIIIIVIIFIWGCGNKLSVSGAWKRGKQELKLTPDNNFTLYNYDSIKYSGIYTVVFDKIFFMNSGNNLSEQCLKPGRYSFTIVNDSLQLIMLDDPCTGRKFMLNDIYWKRNQ